MGLLLGSGGGGLRGGCGHRGTSQPSAKCTGVGGRQTRFHCVTLGSSSDARGLVCSYLENGDKATYLTGHFGFAADGVVGVSGTSSLPSETGISQPQRCDTWGLIICCVGACPVHCRVLSGLPGLCFARCQKHPPPLTCDNQNVSRYCRVPPEGEHPG